MASKELSAGTPVCFNALKGSPDLLHDQYGWVVTNPFLHHGVRSCQVRLCDWTLALGGPSEGTVVTVATRYISVLPPDAGARLTHLYGASFTDADILQRLNSTASDMAKLRKELAQELRVETESLSWPRLWEGTAFVPISDGVSALVTSKFVSQPVHEAWHKLVCKAHDLAYAHSLYVA